MSTDLPRPAIGASIRVLAATDRYPGSEGIVVGFDHRAPVLTRDPFRIVGEWTWDLLVVFLGGRGSAYDTDEVEILYGSPWYSDDGRPWHGPETKGPETKGATSC